MRTTTIRVDQLSFGDDILLEGSVYHVNCIEFERFGSGKYRLSLLKRGVNGLNPTEIERANGQHSSVL